MDTYRKKFKCVDPEDLIIWGDYNSRRAQQLAVKFKICDGGPANGCKEKEEILEWIKGKYIVLLYNQIRFSQEDYFSDSRIEESRILYIPVSSQIRQIIPHKIQETHLELQDHDSIMLDDLTKVEFEDLFKLN